MKWVNANLTEHNETCENKLTRFKMNSTTLRDNDFPNYLNWINWCREMAHKLSRVIKEEWRARDVEMAVFTAQRNKQKKMRLNPLP